MVNLILAVSQWTTQGFWGKLIGLFYNAGLSMGWTIVIFTICLKIVLIPLDIYQRHVSASTTEKQAQMQPELDKVQKIYGSNPEMLNKKTMEVYKAHNFNMGSSCLGLILNLVLTLVIFFTLFGNLRVISKSMIKEEYDILKQTYIESYSDYMKNQYQSDYDAFVIEFDSLEEKGELTPATYAKIKTTDKATLVAQQSVYDKYQEIKESWLWIKNIYLTDTNTSPFPSFETFKENAGETYSSYVPVSELIKEQTIENYSPVTIEDSEIALEEAKYDYETVNSVIIDYSKGKWNGYYILIILSGVITYLSTKISKLGQKKQITKVKLPSGEVVDKEVDPMGMMSFLLPIMMIFFTIRYTGLFAIYIVVNSAVSILISLATFYIRKYIKSRKKGDDVIVSSVVGEFDNYKRVDKVRILDDSKK